MKLMDAEIKIKNGRTLQVYDPAMCCSTGVCGPDVDPELANFAALLSQLQQRGIRIERYNLGQQPVAFVQNAQVKILLEKEGVAALPAIFRNGELLLKGRYPTREERGKWIRLLLRSETKSGVVGRTTEGVR